MGFPEWTLGLMNSAPGSIARRFPAFWSDGEGGIDWTTPPGTPITALADGQVVGAGYFCKGGPFFLQNYTSCPAGSNDYGVITTRVTNQDGTQTDLYYQHIILNPAVGLCANGAASCGGQVVHKGDVIGYSNPGGWLEVGVNVGNVAGSAPYPHGWGGIWGADPSPGPHVDPEAYLRALISGQNTTGTLSGGLTGGSAGFANSPALTGALTQLGPLFEWLHNPMRLVKMVVGLLCILGACILLLVPGAQSNAEQFMSFAQSNPEAFA